MIIIATVFMISVTLAALCRRVTTATPCWSAGVRHGPCSKP
jgi:hypothetical protein